MFGRSKSCWRVLKQNNKEIEVSIIGDLGILVVSRRRVHARLKSIPATTGGNFKISKIIMSVIRESKELGLK